MSAFFNAPAPAVQPCCRCGKRRRVRGWWQRKPVCLWCAKIYARLQRELAEAANV